MTPQLEQVAYGGWKNCLRLTDGRVELIVTLDVGPRIIRFATIGGPNLFKEFPDQMGRTEGKEWLSFGGHRLWHAPEIAPRTYAPDFHPVDHHWNGEVLMLSPVAEPTTGIRKEILIRFENGTVRLDHRLYNENLWAVELSPWCLSVMAAGGRAIVPQEPFVPHEASFVPARPLVLWQFTRMNDPRYTWGDRLIQFRQDDRYPSKQKFGLANKQGWAVYHLGRQLFVKTFDWFADAQYPDCGCNCELFTMPGFFEVESLGPLTKLDPGQHVEHYESWALHDDVSLSDEEAPLLEELKNYVEVKL